MSIDTADTQNTGKGGFFMRIGTWASAVPRLGDILVQNGTLNPEALNRALSIQRADGRRLGQILIDEGLITRFGLRRILLLQRFWRMSAAVVTFMVGIGTISPAVARTETPQTISVQVKTKAHPRLFRTAEFRSSSISRLSKWTTMMARYQSELDAFRQTGSPRELRAWSQKIDQLQSASFSAMLSEVNRFVNRTRYVSDKRNYGRGDYWATPAQFFDRGGDCEDFAIAKFVSLRALGVPAEAMRVVVLDDTRRGVDHAVLVVYTASGAMVLDNETDVILPEKAIRHYRPIYSLNGQSWWMHRT